MTNARISLTHVLLAKYAELILQPKIFGAHPASTTGPCPCSGGARLPVHLDLRLMDSLSISLHPAVVHPHLLQNSKRMDAHATMKC